MESKTQSFKSSEETAARRFEHWISKAGEEIRLGRKHLKAESVHDLRTALRRVRTMALVLDGIIPDRVFRKINKRSKKLFKAFERLRDIQVMKSWIRRLGPAAADECGKLSKKLEKKEKTLARKAARSLERFELRKWQKLGLAAVKQISLPPYSGRSFKPAAAELLKAAMSAHESAQKKKTPRALHRLRIAFKQYRYLLENFLPALYLEWAADLNEIQNLLGDYHDLAVLRAKLKDKEEYRGIRKKIDLEQKLRYERYTGLFSSGHLWPMWRKRLENSAAL